MTMTRYDNHAWLKSYDGYTYCSYNLELSITNIKSDKKTTFKFERAIKALKLLVEEVEIHHENCESTK